MHRDHIFNQKAWLKSYIDNDFKKDFFFKLINNVVFRKTAEKIYLRQNQITIQQNFYY